MDLWGEGMSKLEQLLQCLNSIKKKTKKKPHTHSVLLSAVFGNTSVALIQKETAFECCFRLHSPEVFRNV